MREVALAYQDEFDRQKGNFKVKKNTVKLKPTMGKEKIIIGIALLGCLAIVFKKPSRQKKEEVIKSNPAGVLTQPISLINLSEEEINTMYQDTLKIKKGLTPSLNYGVIVKKYNL